MQIQEKIFEIEPTDEKPKGTDTSSTFIDNMKLPIHRWYRYTAGFSAEWAKSEITSYQNRVGRKEVVVLDPFAGSGTTLLAADECSVRSYGYETQSFVQRVAQAKLLWETDLNSFAAFSNNVLDTALADNGNESESYADIVLRCYSEDNLLAIDRLKRALNQLNDGSDAYWLSWLAFVTILRPTSHAGTATWQYVLPDRSKAKVLDAYDAYREKCYLMQHDMKVFRETGAQHLSTLFNHDAREICYETEGKIDLVLTSPPYANNYDYADATRLEQSVLGEISGWADLNKERPVLVRSCTQAVSKERKQTYEFIDDPILSCIADELETACRKMEIERENHKGKKNYHTMVALYCHDLARVFLSLRASCKSGSEVCFVVGDSAPYGIYCPIDEWLGKLAIAAGFESYKFEKTRDRNIKWKNRKHRVPLKEGRLWIRG